MFAASTLFVALQLVCIAVETGNLTSIPLASSAHRVMRRENIDHGVLAVGDNTDAESDDWKAKNSLGFAWGDGDCVRLFRHLVCSSQWRSLPSRGDVSFRGCTMNVSEAHDDQQPVSFAIEADQVSSHWVSRTIPECDWIIQVGCGYREWNRRQQ